ncbi:GntR family transcriptional regulator [Bacillus sp. 1P06AnD]|uniref:GntR family transcriptional regulator n=1 Tax=Bacillus sp. 1P06AnD TaxID=3132208 RepID=UPI0039A370DB
MWLTLDFESEIPIYTQLVYSVMKGIATGELQSGDPLPSVRSLASDLGVNMHTVNKAYQQLKEERFIAIHSKKCAVIEDPEARKATDEQLQLLQHKLQPLVIEAIGRGLTHAELQKQISLVYSYILSEKE